MDRTTNTQKKNTPAIILGVIVVLLAATTGYLAYRTWDADKQISSKNDEIATQKNQISQLSALKLSDEDAIIAAAKAYDTAVGSASTDMTYTIEKRVDDFASVSIAPNDDTTPGSYGLVLKKVGSIWVPLMAGQSVDEELMKQYGIPESVVQW
jgi:hypothetical protein